MESQSWLRTGRGFPDDGIRLIAEYRPGTGTSHLHLRAISPVITAALGCREVFPGSLNLWAPEPVGFPAPARVSCAGAEWLFVPVAIQESAVGIAARRPPPMEGELIEVFACQQLAPMLRLAHGSRVEIRLMPGAHLEFVV